MKIIESNKGLRKLCHASPGDVIRIPGVPGIYIVSFFPMKNCSAARNGATNGLYSDECQLFIVNVESGEGSPLPHLSSSVEILRNAALVEDAID